MSRIHSYTTRPAVLAVTGEDAKSYLQSQFSNDLNRCGDCPVTYGLFLDRKGKVLYDAFVLQRGAEDFLLVSYHSDPKSWQRKVEENIIADEVEMEDVSAHYQLITLWGDLDALNDFLPPAGAFAARESALIWRGRWMREAHVDCLVAVGAEWPPASLNAAPASAKLLLAERIHAGVPAIPQDIGPADLPQEGADLATAAVSYTKGCYLGQEVMARLHAMGKAQRALYHVKLGTPYDAGRLAVLAGEREIGAVTSHVGGEGLALLKRRYATSDVELCLAKPGGPALIIIREIPA